ncbi:MAG: histone deacetylase [Gemmatimonadetes bacterium]|nr:MAG: histone deacetylase [Gemmatimonadota bacterium]
MHIAYCDHFVLPLPDGHRFPMSKYARLRQRVSRERLGTLFVPDAADDRALRSVHTPEWVAAVATGALPPAAIRRVGFPWSPGLVERSRRSVGGTLAAARHALRDGVAVSLAGGTHHAFPDHGEGFCVFNDVAVAVRSLQGSGALRRVAVIDLDVHQGNGTAAIFHDDPDVFTLSVHGARNYPFAKETSDLDLALPDGTDDEPYLRAVDEGLEAALAHAPQLVFYVAGADAFAGDRLGRLSVSKRGLAARDRRVFERCLHAGVPVAVVMAGGYAARVEDSVDIHAATVREAAGAWRRCT